MAYRAIGKMPAVVPRYLSAITFCVAAKRSHKTGPAIPYVRERFIPVCFFCARAVKKSFILTTPLSGEFIAPAAGAYEPSVLQRVAQLEPARSWQICNVLWYVGLHKHVFQVATAAYDVNMLRSIQCSSTPSNLPMQYATCTWKCSSGKDTLSLLSLGGHCCG
jgi:hypothetical protein